MEKCVVLMSGGLDSRLAIKLMQERDYSVTGVYFKLPFSKDEELEISKFCKKHKVKLKIFECTKGKFFKEYLGVIKKPKHGKGTGLNPCIDCKIFMLKKTKEFADKKKIRFIVTGEVEGQRPMSQQKKQLKIIEEKAKLNGRIIRPLVDKGIKGRTRGKQIRLAKKFKIDYPNPTGGCLLCESLYCKKLKPLLKREIKFKDIELLKIGRHFEDSKIILGRDERENKLLEKERGIKIIPEQPGPTALIKDEKLADKAKELIRKHSKKKIEGFEIINN